MPHSPYAIVRDGRHLIAAGSSLNEALKRAALTFYSGAVPPGLVILECGTEPLPSLVAIPCSERLLLASADAFFLFGYHAVRRRYEPGG